MGNKLSTTSPFSEVTFSDVALSSEVTVGLLEQHFMAKISSDGTPVNASKFVRRVGPQLGLGGQIAAQRLFFLLQTINDRRNNDVGIGSIGGSIGNANCPDSVTFQKFAIAAWVYHRSDMRQRQQIIFFMFDSKRAGALNRQDLATLLLVTSAAENPETYFPGLPLRERPKAQFRGWREQQQSLANRGAKSRGTDAVLPGKYLGSETGGGTNGSTKKGMDQGGETGPSPAALAVAAAADTAEARASQTWAVAKPSVSAEAKGYIDNDPNFLSEKSPFRRFADVMADMALSRFDLDRDGKLSLTEFLEFASTAEQGCNGIGILSDFETLLSSVLVNPVEKNEAEGRWHEETGRERRREEEDGQENRSGVIDKHGGEINETSYSSILSPAPSTSTPLPSVPMVIEPVSRKHR